MERGHGYAATESKGCSGPLSRAPTPRNPQRREESEFGTEFNACLKEYMGYLSKSVHNELSDDYLSKDSSRQFT
jgi:hypothetical protein